MPLSYEDQNDNVTITDADGDQADITADGEIKTTASLEITDAIETFDQEALQILRDMRTELRAIRLYLNLASFDDITNDDLMEDLED